MGTQKRDRVVAAAAFAFAVLLFVGLGPVRAFRAARACPIVSGGTAILTVDPPQAVSGRPVKVDLHVADDVFTEYDFDFDGFQHRPEYGSKTGGVIYRSYAVPGTYTLRARVYFLDGSILDHDTVVTVAAPPGLPAITLTPSVASGAAPLPVRLTVSLSDPSRYFFYFDLDNDGVFDASTHGVPSLDHTFQGTGSFAPRVVAVDSEGRSPTATTAVTVVAGAGPVPSLSLVAPPAIVQLGQPVTFTASASVPGGSITRYDWDLEADGIFDASTVAPVSPVTQYTRPAGCGIRVRAISSFGTSRTSFFSLERAFNPNQARCWIAGPRPLRRVKGQISLRAVTTPGIRTTAVDFYFRPSGGVAWTPIATSDDEFDSFYGVVWNTLGLSAGLYELRAVATGTSGPPADSTSVTTLIVEVGSPTPDIDETSSKVVPLPPGRDHVRIQIVNPPVPDEIEIDRHAVVQVPANAQLTIDRIRLERRSLDPHPFETKVLATREQGYLDPNTFVKMSRENAAPLLRPFRLIQYLGGKDLGPLLSSDPNAPRTLNFFDPGVQVWHPGVNQIYHPSGKRVQADFGATWDSGVAIEVFRADAASSSDPCGLLGVEVLLVLGLVRLFRRRQTGT